MSACEKWTTDNCPSVMLCVPRSNNTNFCSCRYTSTMLESEGDEDCKPTASSFVLAYFCLVFCFLCFLVFANGIRKYILMKQVHIGKTGLLRAGMIAVICAAGSLIGVGVSFVIRPFVINRNVYESLDLLWFVSTILSAFSVVSCLLIFGLSILVSLVLSSSLRGTRDTHPKLLLGTVLSGVVLICGLAPLNYFGLFIVSSAYIALWAFITWFIFWQVSRGVKSFVAVLMPGDAADLLRRKLSSIKGATDRLMIAVTLFNVGTFIYAICYEQGRRSPSQFLLGPMCAAGAGIQLFASLGALVTMSRTITRIMHKKVEAAANGNKATNTTNSATTSLTKALNPMGSVGSAVFV
eukprot:c5106_g1_i1.p1 GENE.c5106_g1_i1~~c5106_g1_i1.p1  ORF type:complete len:352 (-),score=43.90 c5106_g1_i1:75-1130(-)